MFFPALGGQLVKGLEYQIHGAKQEKVNPEEEGSQFRYICKKPGRASVSEHIRTYRTDWSSR